jgi:hypothetical protein
LVMIESSFNREMGQTPKNSLSVRGREDHPRRTCFVAATPG